MSEKKEKKFDRILREVKDIIAGYTTKLTLRQIYYRLVAKLILENKLSQYQYLSRALVKARKEGLISYGVMEDRTRSVVADINGSGWFWKEKVISKIKEVEESPYIFKNGNALQETITLIVLEKEALAGIFKDAISKMCILVVCRGFNSLTQIKQLADLIERSKTERKVNCYFFSDFDPSGYDIQRNFKQQAEELGIVFNKFERVALTESQVREYSLPFSPTKTKDPRFSSWKHAGVVEMDALEPSVLTDMVKGCVIENYDYELEKWKTKVRRIQQRRANKLYAKMLIKKAKELMEEK